MTLRRITSELTDLKKDPLPTCSAYPINDKNLYHWTATISGPPQSLYANREFELNIILPETYPHNPPKIFFTTPIFHPNVSSSGELKMAELGQDQWCPALTIGKLLISVQALLSDANLGEACRVNEEAASLYLKNIEEFRRRARGVR